MEPFSAEFAFALPSVRQAMRVCERVRAHLDAATDSVAKSDDSPVTLADLACQAVIAHQLRQAFPSDPLVGEEDTDVFNGPDGQDLLARVTELVQTEIPSLGTAEVLAAIGSGRAEGGPKGRFWTLDPIDGTKGFLRGDQYAVALALIEEGVVWFGLLGCPNLPAADGQSRGCLFAAARGQGARVWEGGEDVPRAIRVARTGVEDVATLRMAESFESGHSSHSHAEQIATRLGLTQPPLRLDSQAKYGLVARGDAGIYMRLPTKPGYQEKIWDHAAGMIVVEEAGGTVTDVAGAPLDFGQGRTLKNNRGVIATNGAVQGRVLDAVRAVLG